MHKITITFFVLSAQIIYTQTPFGENISWLSGYNKEISGENIRYFSAFPDYVNVALLTRATDGRKSIEWETASVPVISASKYVYFRWVAGHSTGTNSGDRNFDFYINDEKALIITTHQGNRDSSWSFAAADSTKMVFARLRSDGANDAHGIIYLRVPATRVTPGKPLRFKLTGEAHQSNDWFMTFKYAFEEKADINAMPFLLKDGRQPLSITVLHFGKKEKLNVLINKTSRFSFDLDEGMNNFDVPVDAVTKKDSVYVLVKYGDTVLHDGFIKVSPVIQRELYFIPHSHTDIGYSHLQTQVEKIHTKNIYDALYMIEKTKNYPIEAKFKWNVESLWAVENFLQKASTEDSVAFFTAVRNGSIGLSGFYANMMTGLSMPEEVFHYTDYAEILRDKFDLPIESAMITDVPGITWSTIEGFAKGGIKYFSDGPNYVGKNNPYEGDRVGHFVKTWGDKPVWWESPSRKERLLLWVAGRGYSSWHGTSAGAVFIGGKKKIADYLNDLAAENYPYEMVQWRYNIVADNGPIDSTIADFVKQWNEKYASPKIILSTVNHLFETFEKRHGKDLPVVSGDITPYWNDGAASTAHEQGINRVNSLRCAQLATLYAILAPGKYNAAAFYQAWRNILLFTEHTWGAYNSISSPDIDFVKEQWRFKRKFMSDADSILNSLTKTLMHSVSDPSADRIAVVNSLSWRRSGEVYLSTETKAKSITDEEGKTYPLQTLSDGRKLFIAKQLKPLSITYFNLNNNSPAFTPKNPFTITDSSISNGKILIKWNTTNGSITTVEKNGVNFSGTFNNEGLNSYWYVSGRNPQDAVTNGKVTVSVEENGPYSTTISIHSPTPGTNGITRKISLRVNNDEVLIDNFIDKKAARNKEGVYFAFPFSSALNTTMVDAGYGSMQYLKDQLPGSNMDFLSTRRWLDASDDKKGIQLGMKEAFMAAPDSMVDERLFFNENVKRWRDGGKPTSLWFSYVMNNYWHTNFKADQEGISQFQYALKPHGAYDPVAQEKTAEEFTNPLFAFPVNEKVTLPGNLFTLSNEKIIVTSITPQPDGNFLIRLFNPGAEAQSTIIRWESIRPKNIQISSSGKIMDTDSTLPIPGYDVVDYIVNMVQ